jgi:hypothetical protein
VEFELITSVFIGTDYIGRKPENTDFNGHSFVSIDLVVFLLEKKNEI